MFILIRQIVVRVSFLFNNCGQICFYLAEEKSKMMNRGERGGRRVGCIVCGRLLYNHTGVTVV
jgi:hypothetical protein